MYLQNLRQDIGGFDADGNEIVVEVDESETAV